MVCNADNNNINERTGLSMLNSLVGLQMRYGLKSPDTELYDFGFGEFVWVTNKKGKPHKICEYTLHVLCRFKVIWRNGEPCIKRYYEDTSSEEFCNDVKRLIGHRVKRVALSQKNDLWLDFEEYWIVFATSETEDESWRFFSAERCAPHLVASNSSLRLE